MLSKKFKDTIYQLIDDKEKACQYDKITKPNKYEAGNSYSIYYQLLNQVQKSLTSPDNNSYNNYISNCILNNDVLNHGKKDIRDYYIENLKYLDYFSDYNQNIINICLNTYLNPLCYFDINIFENTLINQSEWKFVLLQIYINKLIQKIYFVWQKDKILYIPDIIQFKDYCKQYNINFTPLDNYSTIYWNIIISCNTMQSTQLISFLSFLTSLVKKYKDITVFEVPVKFDLDELKKLKVIGLKDLCIKHNIKIKSGSVRNDYINALLNY